MKPQTPPWREMSLCAFLLIFAVAMLLPVPSEWVRISAGLAAAWAGVVWWPRF